MICNLGDEVKDIITGYKGIVVAKTQWINGCIRYSVQQKCKKDSPTIPEPQMMDEPQTIILKRGKVSGPENELGKVTSVIEEEKLQQNTGGPKPALPKCNKIPTKF